MAIRRRRLVFMALPFVTGLICPFAGWAGGDDSRQGQVLTVQGQAFVGRMGSARPQLVSFHGQVRPHDVIETQLASRVKLLLPHDVLVTIGENSRVELSEFPDGKSRHAVLNCERGIVRLNVGPPEAGLATQVAVQTPTGRMVSEGAYFIVWAVERVAQIGSGIGGLPAISGVFNLGPEGNIILTVEGASVSVKPGQVAIVDPERHPRLVSQSRLPSLTTVVEATELKDVPDDKPVKEVLASIVPFVPVLFTPPAVISGAAALTPSAAHSASPAVATAPAVASVNPASAPVVSPSATASPVVSPAPGVMPSTVATVPAAISSAGQLLNSLLGDGQQSGRGRRSGR